MPHVIWRGIHFSPLFCWGKYTAHFSNGIVYGKAYHPLHTVYYNGHWIISVDQNNEEFYGDFIESKNKNTWPEEKTKIIKYRTGRHYGIYQYLCDLVRKNE
jgi:hypothetical protein